MIEYEANVEHVFVSTILDVVYVNGISAYFVFSNSSVF